MLLLVPVVLGIVAVWLMTMEYQRRESLAVLEKNYAVCERWWTPPFSKPVGGKDVEAAMESWFSHPKVICTEPSHLVSPHELGLAIRRLKPEELLMNGAGRFEAEFLEQLARTSSIKILEIADSTVRDDSMPYLARMKSLEQLSLEETEITGKALDWLGKCPSLKVLLIGNTAITDAEAQAFAKKHPHLRVIW
ncbi:hypothetical protein [Roseimicrobium sp. ORNL1]|uniref:hypothetical protein n=1 Tax=Roseimicrobium sp. ORNL1 TaxID=2711231 RepID=UPI0019806850|nr:hypothetical protein [Roseimicrobium sp. ORNL1]